QQALAWSAAIADDVDGALRDASASLGGLSGQDEPFWTASAGLTLGATETTLGRYDDAMGHLNEVRDLAERIDNTWLAAISRMALGALALVQSRLAEARPLPAEAPRHAPQ